MAREAAATTLDPSWTTPHRVPRRSSRSSSPTTPGPGSRRSSTASPAQDYPNLRVLVLDAGTVRRPGRTRRRRACPGAFVRRLGGPTPASARPPTRCCGSSRARRSTACSTTTWPSIPTPSACWSRRPTARTPASSGRSWSTGTTPEHVLEVGVGRRQVRRARPARRAGRARPGAARRRARRVLRAVGVPARARRPVRAPSAASTRASVLRRRPRPVLAGPRRRRAGAGRAGRAGPPPSGRWPSAGTATTGRRLAARHRLRTVLGNYSGGHLLRVLPQHALLTRRASRVGGLVTGRGHAAAGRAGRLAVEPGAGSASCGPSGAASRPPAARPRPRGPRPPGAGQRPSGRVLPRPGRGRQPLQRGRCGPAQPRRRHPRPPRSSIVAWVVFLALFLIGSRSLITDGVAAVGTLLPFPAQATDLFREYLSPWSFHGLGSAVPLPTGCRSSALGGSGHLRPDGAAADPARARRRWRSARSGHGASPCRSEPAGQARRLVLYAAVPLGYNAVATGRWAGVLVYAAMPWVLLSIGQALRPRAVRSPRGRRPTAVRGPRRRPRPPHGGRSPPSCRCSH